jgi:acyl carrier protein
MAFNPANENEFGSADPCSKPIQCGNPIREGGQGMSIRSAIASQFEQVAIEQKRKLARLSDDLKLLDSGLDSLSFALIVARLEDSLGFDPFDVAEEMKFPVTFGDFVRVYEKHRK